eukprot:2753054-Amphidinium_carterae.1
MCNCVGAARAFALVPVCGLDRLGGFWLRALWSLCGLNCSQTLWARVVGLCDGVQHWSWLHVAQ